MNDTNEDRAAYEFNEPLPTLATAWVGEPIALDVLQNEGKVEGHAFRLASACAPDGKGVARVDEAHNQLIFDPAHDFDYLPSGSSEPVQLYCTVVDDEGSEAASLSMWVNVAGRQKAEARVR